MASKSDYYEVLGLKKGASASEIKTAYRKQALEWHPDRHKDNKETAEKRFKEINEAYQVLSDPQKKTSYDQYGHAGAGNPFAGGQSGRGPFTYSYSTNGGQGQNPFAGFDFGDPFDIFEQFFGGAGRAPRVPTYSLAIEFMDAVKGVTKEVEVDGKRRKIKIPPGVGEGSRINFNDFILSVRIAPHETFEREGNDVYVTVTIPFSLAISGGEVKVPTVDGQLKLKIHSGTKPGTMMRLRGQGIKELNGRGKGDEYVRFTIEVPEKLTRKQKGLVEAMREEGL